ncbi:MAG: arginine--tRNA ligase [Candidatus Woesearchaeota archaeon]|nr:MAG: arginine--tRNA ligase [Candidatus Woesearchaeota archaeon]
MDFVKELQRLVHEAFGVEVKISRPKHQKFGDYSLAAFDLQRAFPGKSVQEIAAQVKQVFSGNELFEQVVEVGPYVNFFVKKNLLAKAAFEEPTFEKKTERVLIEFSAPNVAKPFSFNHIRTTLIGAALCRIYREVGYDVIAFNHLGDWGTQYGKLIVAFQKWGTEEALHAAEDKVDYLVSLYVKFHKEAEIDTTLDEKAREAFAKLEQGDATYLAQWKEFRDLSVKEFDRVYKRLGIEFDQYLGESDYNKDIPPLLAELEKKNLLVTSEGAKVVELEGMPPCIILKSDGSSIYATRDIAAALFRFNTFHFHKMIYVVGAEQKLHFQQFFGVIKKMGYDWIDNVHHVSFGLIKLATKEKMSTRKGTIIKLSTIFDKAKELAKQIIEEKNAELAKESSLDEVAEQVGVGAIIFNDLKTDRNAEVMFDWDKLLSFEGETGPYVQYTHARIKSILRKSSLSSQEIAAGDTSLLTEQEELLLINKLNAYTEALIEVINQDKPHVLARYLIDLAQTVNNYYAKVRIVQEDKQSEAARLRLLVVVADRIKKGLLLLGIAAPEQM